MISLAPIYQTVRLDWKHKAKPSQQPIKGQQDGWLLEGYYFWDTFIDIAKWWGETHCRGHYAIYEASVEVEDENYLDVYGNLNVRYTFYQMWKRMKEKDPSETYYFKHLISAINKKCHLDLKVLRVETKNCGNYMKEGVLFAPSNKSMLYFMPPVQICVYDKDVIKGYHLVFKKNDYDQLII